MSDIVERLRAWHAPGETITGDVQLYLDAAAEITRLREQVRSLHSLAYAPDGKEMRKALFEEAEKRGNAEAEVARLGILVERTTWQPIETAPKNGSFVHLWFPNNGSALSDLCLTCRWAPDGWWIAQSGGRGFRMDGPSHWKAIVPPLTSDDTP